MERGRSQVWVRKRYCTSLHTCAGPIHPTAAAVPASTGRSMSRAEALVFIKSRPAKKKWPDISRKKEENNVTAVARNNGSARNGLYYKTAP